MNKRLIIKEALNKVRNLINEAISGVAQTALSRAYEIRNEIGGSDVEEGNQIVMKILKRGSNAGFDLSYVDDLETRYDRSQKASSRTQAHTRKFKIYDYVAQMLLYIYHSEVGETVEVGSSSFPVTQGMKKNAGEGLIYMLNPTDSKGIMAYMIFGSPTHSLSYNRPIIPRNQETGRIDYETIKKYMELLRLGLYDKYWGQKLIDNPQTANNFFQYAITTLRSRFIDLARDRKRRANKGGDMLGYKDDPAIDLSLDDDVRKKDSKASRNPTKVSDLIFSIIRDTYKDGLSPSDEQEIHDTIKAEAYEIFKDKLSPSNLELFLAVQELGGIKQVKPREVFSNPEKYPELNKKFANVSNPSSALSQAKNNVMSRTEDIMRDLYKKYGLDAEFKQQSEKDAKFKRKGPQDYETGSAEDYWASLEKQDSERRRQDYKKGFESSLDEAFREDDLDQKVEIMTQKFMNLFFGDNTPE